MALNSHKQSFILLFFFIILLSTHLPGAESQIKPNEPAKSAPAAKRQAVMLPLLIEKQSLGEIQVLIPTDRAEVQIEGLPLLKAFAQKVKPAIIDQLKQAIGPEGYLSLKLVKATGFDAEYDEQNLEIHINIPPALRPPSEISLTGRGNIPLDAQQAIKPSLYSAFINLRSGVDYVEQTQPGRETGAQPVRLDLEGGLNIGNWVLESDGRFNEESARQWQRGNTRLIHDIPSQRLRFALGDLSYPVTGLQTYQQLMGLSLARNFSLQPYRVTTPMGNTSFFLKSNSKVEVLVNGSPVQTLRLQAGPHQLSDFQFASGANDVVLKITDDVGRVETIHLSYFFDYQLLAKGEQEFSYNLGVTSSTINENRHYEMEIPSLSMFHRYGISDALTAGLNFQGSEQGQMLGGETLWANSIGAFQNELAMSQIKDYGFDFATRFQYRFSDAARS